MYNKKYFQKGDIIEIGAWEPNSKLKMNKAAYFGDGTTEIPTDKAEGEETTEALYIKYL